MNEENKIPSWKEILNFFYESSPIYTQEVSSREEFSEGLFGENAEAKVSFLEEQKLIKITKEKTEGKKGCYIVELTSKGFDVALNNEKHERELEIQESQKKINLKLTIATIIVAIATALSSFITAYNFLRETKTSQVIIVVVILIIAFLFFYLIKYIFCFFILKKDIKI